MMTSGWERNELNTFLFVLVVKPELKVRFSLNEDVFLLHGNFFGVFDSMKQQTLERNLKYLFHDLNSSNSCVQIFYSYQQKQV